MKGFTHARVKELLFSLLDLDDQDRPAFLDRECGEDRGLRLEVESLLAEYESLDGFLERRVDLSLVGRPTDAPATPELPDRVGSYTIRRVLGWGSMGVVYLAEQRNPERPVALKVLRHDGGGSAARRRFEREGAMLGRLHHPGIAQVYEAGIARTDVGDEPFLAMEFVDGVSLWEYCKAQGLDDRQRIELVLRIADALQHAHSAGILHRDVKPENVLVTEDGQPKLLDFGVARLAEADGGDSFHTQTGQVLGTVAYMSPEQARGAELDPRSDEFSLAVVLFQLLTDQLPFRSRGELIDDIVERRTAAEALPLSEFRPDLRGDLEILLQTALDHEPARRYASVALFAEDLQNYLAGRPVNAQAPTQIYRIRKLVDRNRGVAATVMAVFLILSLALGAALVGLKQVSASEKKASVVRDAVIRLADLERLHELREQAHTLWPLGPGIVERLDEWLRVAGEIETHADEHAHSLRQWLELRDRGELDLSQIGGDAVVGGNVWLLGQLQKLESEIEDFFGPNGLHDQMRARRQACREIFEHTLEDHAERWQQAIAAIADPELHPEYEGLRIEPQLGLVPLGPDPHSNLWEFAHFGQTGTIPERGDDGELVIGEETAIVFVLIPGGGFSMGIQKEDPGAPRFDGDTRGHEGPPRWVELEPYFMAKHETTQGQWMRVEGINPSHWQAGETAVRPITARHPVEQVSHPEALAFLERLGCTLPTEAQWERGALAGCDAVFAHGHSNPWGLDHVMSKSKLHDGYRVHMPVGSFEPNGFGLHDMDGNLHEWCLDDYKVRYFHLPLDPATGLVLADGGGDSSIRGGCYVSAFLNLRIGKREEKRFDNRQNTVGFRAARALQGRFGYRANKN